MTAKLSRIGDEFRLALADMRHDEEHKDVLFR